MHFGSEEIFCTVLYIFDIYNLGLHVMILIKPWNTFTVSLTAIQIVNVHGNSTTQRIDIVWKDVPGKQNKVIYRIEVYYTGQKEAIHTVSL